MPNMYSPANGLGSVSVPACPACGRAVARHWPPGIFCGALLDGCPRCGSPRQNVEGEAFCAHCGAPLQQQPDLPTVPLEGHEPGSSS